MGEERAKSGKPGLGSQVSAARTATRLRPEATGPHGHMEFSRLAKRIPAVVSCERTTAEASST